MSPLGKADRNVWRQEPTQILSKGGHAQFDARLDTPRQLYYIRHILSRQMNEISNQADHCTCSYQRSDGSRVVVCPLRSIRLGSPHAGTPPHQFSIMLLKLVKITVYHERRATNDFRCCRNSVCPRVGARRGISLYPGLWVLESLNTLIYNKTPFGRSYRRSEKSSKIGRTDTSGGTGGRRSREGETSSNI